MRLILPPLALLVYLSACAPPTPEQQAKIEQALTVACNVDGAVVPAARPVVAALGQAGTTAANADLLVHPAVVEACKSLNGTPVSVAPVGAAATVTPKPAN